MGLVRLRRWQRGSAYDSLHCVRQGKEGLVTLQASGLRLILLVIAIILFILAAIGVGLGSVSLVPLGLAFMAGALLV